MNYHQWRRLPALRFARRAYRALAATFETVYCLLYDAFRYVRWSAAIAKFGSTRKHDALVTKYYHIVEKGLSLKSPRPGFGEYAVGQLIELLEKKHVGRPSQLANEALVAYQQFNQQAGMGSPSGLDAYLRTAQVQGPAISAAATKPASTSDGQWFLGSDPNDFFSSRQSVRNFTAEPITAELLTRAAQIAQSTPSVCNRQAVQVHYVTNAALKRTVLSLQDGNRGFGETAPVVAVVTSSLDHFVEPRERYQAWIDGGMFCMTLLLAFHALGIGTCPLNWSAHPNNDRALRKALGLAAPESVIMLIAIGKTAAGAVVARSPRKLISEVVSMHSVIE